MPSTPPTPIDIPEPSAAAVSPFWAVVPAGGSGTRLWPLSRSHRPKYLLPLLGDRSLLQTTLDRLAPLAGPAHTLVVCGAAHAAAVARQLPTLPDDHILVEPSPRGTGPAIGLAAALIARRNPGAIMGSFAADHDVRDPVAFERAVRVAVAAARQGFLATVGITATRPETGYGYIERTETVVASTADGVAYRAARFIEKPDLATATAFLAGGRHCWNASMFVWSVAGLMAELERHQPALAAGLAAIADAWETPDRERVLGAVWPTLPEVTVDTGVMERADRVAVVPMEMGWSDVGDWHGLGELLPADPDGNCGSVSGDGNGDVLLTGSRRSVVWSQTDRLVAVVGLDDVVVVDTPDALLVTRRDLAQSVKTIVAELKTHDRPDLT